MPIAIVAATGFFLVRAFLFLKFLLSGNIVTVAVRLLILWWVCWVVIYAVQIMLGMERTG